MRCHADAAAPTLCVSALWNRDGVLKDTQYFWPPLPHGDSTTGQMSLVRLDCIIDYIDNLLLIYNELPTTLHRMQLTHDMYSAPPFFEEQQRLSRQQKQADAEAAQTISPETVPCIDEPYEFDKSVFCETPDKRTGLRTQREPLYASVVKIIATPIRKHKFRKPIVKDFNSNDCDDSDSDDKIENHLLNRGGGGDGGDGDGGGDGGDPRYMSVAKLEKKLGTSVAESATRMHTTQYELEHPHYMSPLHQQLFIGQLNEFKQLHSSAELRQLRASDIAPRCFGLDANRPTSWSIAYILALAQQMSRYVLQLLHCVKQKAANGEMQYVYGDKERAAAIEHDVYCFRFQQIQHQIGVLVRMLTAQASAFQQHTAPPVPDQPTLLSLSVLAPVLVDPAACARMTPYQHILRRLLQECEDNGYRRHQGAIYCEKRYNGRSTHSYERFCDIERFVWRSSDQNFELDQWLAQTSHANINEQVIKFLSNIDSPQFPTLRIEQFCWSFRNGIYDGRLDRFFNFDDNAAESPVQRDAMSAKFFDKQFRVELLMSAEARAEPSRITVHAAQRILDTQQLSAAVQQWFWAFSGRLYFPQRMCDKWQVVLWLKGVAGTGKSTLLNMLRFAYEPSDVGVLQNNIEPQFGLEPFVDKLLLIAPDIKANFSLDAALFQTMVSADAMSVSRKGRVALPVPEWSIPQVYASNVFPRWVDSSGSLQRRIAPILFNRVVPDNAKDSALDAQMLEQSDAMLVRSCRTYRQMCAKVGNDNVWNHLPQEFRAARLEVGRQATNLVVFFEQFLVLSSSSSIAGLSSVTDGTTAAATATTTTTNQMDFVDIADLTRIYNHTHHHQGSSQKVDFLTLAKEDLASFNCALRIETLNEVSRTQVIRGCRLHLTQARKALNNPQWLPESSKYYNDQDMLLISCNEQL